VSKPLVRIQIPSQTFSLLPTRRTNSAMISSSLASFVFDTRLMFSMTVFCDRTAVNERRCLSVKVIVDTLLSYADVFPLSPPKAPMFRVRSCDAAGSTDNNFNKSSGETLVDVIDNFSRSAKPGSGSEDGPRTRRRMPVNETSTRLRFGTNVIRVSIEESESDVWRSFNVRRAGRENSFSVSKLVRSCANAVSV
jgi:hypothetical protein